MKFMYERDHYKVTKKHKTRKKYQLWTVIQKKKLIDQHEKWGGGFLFLIIYISL